MGLTVENLSLKFLKIKFFFEYFPKMNQNNNKIVLDILFCIEVVQFHLAGTGKIFLASSTLKKVRNVILRDTQNNLKIFKIVMNN